MLDKNDLTNAEKAKLFDEIIVASYGQIASTKVEYNTTETIVWRVNTSI